jgi:D-alanyl-D-alanine carboxypeptidase (penicillin-binding protein 5/6)
MEPPTVGPAAALVEDFATQAIIYEHNADLRLAPASTTKMMTALIALQRGNLSERVRIQADDLRADSVVGLQPGEEWTLEELLYALLLPSDNASALVIARHIAGSEEAFVEMMNAQAAAWGLANTHFANPHGYDDPNHYSTARDLAAIALHGMEHPVFARIVATREYRVGSRTLVNLNQLLGLYEGIQGVKTGTTENAGQCLVSAAQRADGHVLCVVLGSSERYSDTRALLDYYFAHFVEVPLTLGPQALTRVHLTQGEDAVLALEQEAVVFLPRWQLPWLRVQRTVLPLKGLAKQDRAGTAIFRLGAHVLAEVPLRLVEP